MTLFDWLDFVRAVVAGGRTPDCETSFAAAWSLERVGMGAVSATEARAGMK
jgi:hypothetical protein